MRVSFSRTFGPSLAFFRAYNQNASILDISTWNPKHGCFNWMIPNLYIENGCFTKHPFFNGCLGFQVYIIYIHSSAPFCPFSVLDLSQPVGRLYCYPAKHQGDEESSPLHSSPPPSNLELKTFQVQGGRVMGSLSRQSEAIIDIEAIHSSAPFCPFSVLDLSQPVGRLYCYPAKHQGDEESSPLHSSPPPSNLELKTFP